MKCVLGTMSYSAAEMGNVQISDSWTMVLISPSQNAQDSMKGLSSLDKENSVGKLRGSSNWKFVVIVS